MSMSGFKELMQETNSGLLNLEVLMHRAESLRPLQAERILPTRKAIETSLDAIMKAIEELSSRLRENEVLRQTGRRNLHLRWTECSKDGTGHRSVGGDTGMQT